MGLEVQDSIIVTLKRVKPKLIVGSGKAEEIVERVKELEADCIIFDGDISPSQQRNWEELSGVCVIDRTEVILDIFADRAVTREAILQVGLARMEYSLPRLTRAWTHLSRQRGGTKGTRGEGETQLEVDRRLVLKRISRIKKDLEVVKKERDTQRKKRTSIPVPTGSIVGYTNAGKSSLLNRLTNADVLVENKLFATLDATIRKVRLPGGFDALISDTVGFIRNLPHSLVEAFKSTLEEAVYADFIIHIIDASNPEYKSHISTTNEVLKELGADKKDQLIVFNKIDILDTYKILEMEYPDAIFISAAADLGMIQLLEKIQDSAFKNSEHYKLKIPVYRGDINALLHRSALIMDEKLEDEYFIIEAAIPKRIKKSLKEFFID